MNIEHAYGASLKTLVKNSGLPADKLETALAKHKEKYPGLYAFDDSVMEMCVKTRRPSNQRTANGFTAGIGFWRSPTNLIYHFMETDALPFQVDQGIYTSFTPTITKNYPSQGFGGEIMQVQSGRVFRYLLQNDLLGRICMINNVHDAIYTDNESKELALQHYPKICALLEDVQTYFRALHGMELPLPFPVEGVLGDSLYEHHTVIKERDYSWCMHDTDEMCYHIVTRQWK